MLIDLNKFVKYVHLAVWSKKKRPKKRMKSRYKRQTIRKLVAVTEKVKLVMYCLMGFVYRVLCLIMALTASSNDIEN